VNDDENQRAQARLREAFDMAARGPFCDYCGAPATCLGAYEGQPTPTYACDDCCGHGNEDGRCVALDEEAT
jgi:hypothetical protein